MAQFEELQQLWQHQPQRDLPSREAAALSNSFRRYGRRHDLIYLGKTVMIVCQLALLVWLLRQRPLVLLGACIADFGGILYMVSDWRAQRAIARLNFAGPSVEFLRSAIARLEAQRNPFRRREFYAAMVVIWIGCTLMFVNMEPHMTLWSALPALLYGALPPFAGYAIGRRVRRKRFEKECRPLIERLEGVLGIMEANRV
jgi:hypothetical protein